MNVDEGSIIELAAGMVQLSMLNKNLMRSLTQLNSLPLMNRSALYDYAYPKPNELSKYKPNYSASTAHTKKEITSVNTSKGYFLNFEKTLLGSPRITGNPAIVSPEYTLLSKNAPLRSASDAFFSTLLSCRWIERSEKSIQYSIPFIYVPAVVSFIRVHCRKTNLKLSINRFTGAVFKCLREIIYSHPGVEKQLLECDCDLSVIRRDWFTYSCFWLFSACGIGLLSTQAFLNDCPYCIDSDFLGNLTKIKGLGSDQWFGTVIDCAVRSLLSPLTGTECMPSNLEDDFSVTYDYVPLQFISAYLANTVDKTYQDIVRSRSKIFTEAIDSIAKMIPEDKDLSAESAKKIIAGIYSKVKRYFNKIASNDFKIPLEDVDPCTQKHSHKIQSKLSAEDAKLLSSTGTHDRAQKLPFITTKISNSLYSIADRLSLRAPEENTILMEYYLTYLQHFIGCDRTMLQIMELTSNNDETLFAVIIEQVRSLISSIKDKKLDAPTVFSHVYTIKSVKPKIEKELYRDLLIAADYYQMALVSSLQSQNAQNDLSLEQVADRIQNAELYSSEVFPVFELIKEAQSANSIVD